MSTIDSLNAQSANYLRAKRAYKTALEANRGMRSGNSTDVFQKQQLTGSQLTPGGVISADIATRKSAAISQTSPSSTNFASVFAQASEERIKKVKRAEEQTAAALSGNSDAIEVMAAVAESELALKEIVAVRDRLIGAYQEILRMAL